MGPQLQVEKSLGHKSSLWCVVPSLTSWNTGMGRSAPGRLIGFLFFAFPDWSSVNEQLGTRSTDLGIFMSSFLVKYQDSGSKIQDKVMERQQNIFFGFQV